LGFQFIVGPGSLGCRALRPDLESSRVAAEAAAAAESAEGTGGTGPGEGAALGPWSSE